MKKIFVILCLVFVTSGCMQSREHLVINQDGSGTLEAEVHIPQGAIQMADMMFGAMVQAMSQAFESEQEPQKPESVADQMFKKQDFIDKAEKTGVNIEILNFEKEKKEDGVHAKYKIQFDDIEKFLQSEIISTKILVKQDAAGEWFCETKADPQKAEQSKAQMDQLKTVQDSEDFKNMNPIAQNMITSALKDLKFEFFVTMPFEIGEVSGGFQKVGNQTAAISISGDVFSDPGLIEKLYGLSAEASRVSWNSDKPASSPVLPLAQLEAPSINTLLDQGSEGSPKGSPKGSMDGPPKGSPKGSMDGSPKGSPKGSMDGSPKGSPKESMDGFPKGSSKGSPKGSMDGSPKDSPKGSSKGSPKGAMDGSPKGSMKGSEKGSLKISPVGPEPVKGSTIKVFMKNGNYVEGKLIEETDERIVVEMFGLNVTYFKDEIGRIEKGEANE